MLLGKNADALYIFAEDFVTEITTHAVAVETLVTEVISEVIETVIVTVITLEREKERVRLEDLGRVGEEDLD
jgi:hypothetical protein